MENNNINAIKEERRAVENQIKQIKKDLTAAKLLYNNLNKVIKALESK